MRTCLLLVSSVLAVWCSPQCDSSREKNISFSLSNRRNATGHWNLKVFQVWLSQETSVQGEDRENGPVRVDVDQRTRTCDGGVETVVVEASVSSTPPRAGPGYELVPGVGRYKLHPTKLMWEQARVLCLQEGGHLAIIDSTEENDALTEIFNRYKSAVTYVVYLGFHDEHFEGQFLTVLGHALNSSGALKWSPSEPSGSRAYNCGCLHPTGLICDVGCTDLLSFFCEQELF